MKNFKLKIFSLVICVAMVLATLSGCALLVTNNSKALDADAMKVGSTTISKRELVSLWNSYNTSNPYASMYMSSDEIVEDFYKSVVLHYATIEEAKKLIEDGVLQYTQKDESNVWENVFSSYGSAVDTYEKKLITNQTDSEDYLPDRLKTKTSSSASSSEKSYKFAQYHFAGMEDYECDYLVTDKDGNHHYHGEPLAYGYDVGEDISDNSVRQMITLYENKYLYLYAAELDDDDKLENHYDRISDYETIITKAYNGVETKYFKVISSDEKETRLKAYKMLVGQLKLNASLEGKNSDQEVVVFEQFKKSYVSAYESYLQSMYNSYVMSLIDKAGSGELYTLNDRAVVARYLQLLGKDIESYLLEDDYVALMEGSQTDALLTYNFGGKYYYFSVQHLLVKFDADITNALAELDGSNNEASKEQYEQYAQARENYYANLGLSGWTEYANVVYVDENGYAVYEWTHENDLEEIVVDLVYYGGADKDYESVVYPEGDETPEEDRKTAYYYWSGDEKVYLTNGEVETLKRAKVDVQKVLDVFNITYKNTIAALNDGASASLDAETIHANLKELKDAGIDFDLETGVEYVISTDFIQEYLDAADKSEIAYKIYANLFLQHAYKYSSNNDALSSTLSGLTGMIISSRDDNNTVGGGTYVAEFTNGARALLERYLTDGSFKKDQIGEQNFVYSDYGIHIVIINDVFETASGEPEPITKDDISFVDVFGDETQIDDKVALAVENMNKVYVCRASSQTVYEYFYEKVQSELVGTSGLVYKKYRNKLFNDYMGEKVEFISKLSYQELTDLAKSV